MFVPPRATERIRANSEHYPWVARLCGDAVEAARPWRDLDDERLWDLMFGATLPRSWMVWSNGHCPACKQSVPMYNWVGDPFAHPWKLRCPHCSELFPKNDFAAYYRSGLDERHVFDPVRADRSLLFNAEHPEPADPLHRYGVDDGHGYVEGDKRWRFIAAYLPHSHWKLGIVAGIQKLSIAYVATGDLAYAHRALLLLDRVADLYPEFDWRTQAWLYEVPAAELDGKGYVSTWHDACEETREMALGYDRVKDAVPQVPALQAFLAEKAARHSLANPKASFDDIRRNIEERILRDAIANRIKIYCNYPATDVTIAMMLAILGRPEDREGVRRITDEVIARSTAVDGVTGEKGLSAYSAYVLQRLALFLAYFDRAQPGFLADLLERFPALRRTFRFHIDTWVFQRYYPTCGDAGAFARRTSLYVGVLFNRGITEPSMYELLWKLHQHTGDPAYAQTLYLANDRSLTHLPHDALAEDPPAFQQAVADVIAQHGPAPRCGSINFTQWRLAIFRRGQDDTGVAMFLDYDGMHGHHHGHGDGLNLGLYAHGLDLMPDLGYPPVSFGGWSAPRAQWYIHAASHNTVVVDGKTQFGLPPERLIGRTTLWADGRTVRAVRASGPDIAFEEAQQPRQFERTVVMLDTSERDSYLVDVFRVVGGTDHAKFQHSHFGTISTHGLSLEPSPDFGPDLQMRNFRSDSAPAPGWIVDWRIEDRYRYLPPGTDVRLRYVDLTTGASASVCEGWVLQGMFEETVEGWIPRVMVRRSAVAPPLASTFVAVIEPSLGPSALRRVRRLALLGPDRQPCSDAEAAVEVTLTDGRRDVVVARDLEDVLGRRRGGGTSAIPKPPGGGSPPAAAALHAVELPLGVGQALRTDAELCVVRLDAAGGVETVTICRGSVLSVGALEVRARPGAELLELSFTDGSLRIAAGDAEALESVTLRGERLAWS